MYPSPAEQYQPWVHVHTMRCLLNLVKSRQALRASRSLVKFTTMTAPFVQRSGKRRSGIPCLGHSHAMAVAWLSMPCMAFTRAYSLFALLLMYNVARSIATHRRCLDGRTQSHRRRPVRPGHRRQIPIISCTSRTPVTSGEGTQSDRVGLRRTQDDEIAGQVLAHLTSPTCT